MREDVIEAMVAWRLSGGADAHLSQDARDAAYALITSATPAELYEGMRRVLEQGSFTLERGPNGFGSFLAFHRSQ